MVTFAELVSDEITEEDKVRFRVSVDEEHQVIGLMNGADSRLIFYKKGRFEESEMTVVYAKDLVSWHIGETERRGLVSRLFGKDKRVKELTVRTESETITTFIPFKEYESLYRHLSEFNKLH